MAKAKTKAKAHEKKTAARAKPAAKAKVVAKAKVHAKAKVVAKPAAATPEISGERIELVMLGARPHLPDRMRTAFRSQCTDERAQELGGETRAQGVLAEARKWCVVLDRTLSQLRPGQTVRYSADRLTWLLECVAELADTIEAEGGRARGHGTASASAGVAEQRARAARNDLLLALEEISDGNAALEAELATTRGASQKPGEVLASLRDLTDLGTRWASSFDPNVHALAESVGLTRADLGKARDAADALAEALGGKTQTTARRGNDSAKVNAIEGRVLFEMGKAMTPANDAAKRGIGETLTPGPATRAVLSRAAARPAAAKPAATVAGKRGKGGAPDEAGGNGAGTKAGAPNEAGSGEPTASVPARGAPSEAGPG